jgi:hypothetical protein
VEVMSADEDYVDGELLGAVSEITTDNLSKIQWRMRTGEVVYVKDMEDSHIRNTAMFLAGFGYTKCVASEEIRVAWLRVFKMEWERRMIAKTYGNKRFIVYGERTRKQMN